MMETNEIDQSQVTKEINDLYRDYVYQFALLRYRMFTSIGIILNFVFLGLDYFVYPTQISVLFKIRAVEALILFLCVLISYWPKIRPYFLLLLGGIGISFIAAIDAMIFFTNGSNSPYFGGVNLIIIGVSLTNPFFIRYLIVYFIIGFGLTDAAMIFGPGPFNFSNFMSGNYFIFSTIVIVIAMATLYKDQHYKAFVRQERLRISMENEKRAREKVEEVEKALQKQAEELARSNRELEQFAYVASHDLQEPLRMVASFCQKLEKRYIDKLDQDANEYIHFAVDGAKRMQILIDALLSYARVGKKDVTIEAVDLNKVMATILHDLDAVIKEKKATLKVGHLPVIMANQVQMAQLFQNFTTNALKFKGANDPVVEISSRKLDEGFEFTVSDNGIGIDEKHFPKIFVIFNRLHERGAYPGTGIGLALCKKIVENFGGKVWVTSKVGEGTSFYFILNVKGA